MALSAEDKAGSRATHEVGGRIAMNINLVRQQISNLELRFPQLVEDAEAWALSIDSETSTFDVLRQIERRRQEAASMAGALASNIAEIELRQARFVEREKAMRDLGFKIMEIAGLKKAEFAEATYSIRNGQQKLVGGDNLNPENAVEEFQRIKYEFNREAIKEALKRGENVPGFSLSNAEPSLSIRTK